MSLTSYGSQSKIEGRCFGPLALIVPLLERMNVMEIIDRFIPPDPQAEFSHGKVLSLLNAGRVFSPMALINVAAWAADSGADILWDMPIEKINDDRLGRSLDAFFTQRHSILAEIALHVAREFDVSLRDVHYDPTHILFRGAYEDAVAREPVIGEIAGDKKITRSDDALGPAHITAGRATDDAPHGSLMIHTGLCTHMDEFGPLPFFGHTSDGNQNGRTAVAVFSTADQKVVRKQRQKQIDKLRQGLEQIQKSVAAGRRGTDLDAVTRRVGKLFGTKEAARYFQWELKPLTAAERKRLPKPGRGCKVPKHCFAFSFDGTAVKDDEQYDGYSALVTTVPKGAASADELFTRFKQQCYSEQVNSEFKGPLAIRPVFLHSPQRVEALVFLMMIALTLYYLLQRLYRQSVPAKASPKERHTTTQTILRAFTNYTLSIHHTKIGLEVQTTRLTTRQREILQRLGFQHHRKFFVNVCHVPRHADRPRRPARRRALQRW